MTTLFILAGVVLFLPPILKIILKELLGLPEVRDWIKTLGFSYAVASSFFAVGMALYYGFRCWAALAEAFVELGLF